MNAFDVAGIYPEVASERRKLNLIVSKHLLRDDRNSGREVTERLDLIGMEAVAIVVSTIERELLISACELCAKQFQHGSLALLPRHGLLAFVPIGAIVH